MAAGENSGTGKEDAYFAPFVGMMVWSLDATNTDVCLEAD